MLNQFILQGRLVKDITVVKSDEDKNKWSAAYFTLAVDGPKRKDGTRKTDFFECQAYGRLGENMAKYNHQGDGVVISGHLAKGRKTDKEGNEVIVIKLIVDNYAIGARKRTDEGEKRELKEGPQETVNSEDNYFPGEDGDRYQDDYDPQEFQYDE